MTFTIVPPSWRPRLRNSAKKQIPSGPLYAKIKNTLSEKNIATVCQSALCPNRSDCWMSGSLAFQILGNVCTRRCAFCGETTGRPRPPDDREPEALAEAVLRLGLKHVVITSPSRDDLPDLGAGQFAKCIEILRRTAPRVTIEILIPDFQRRPDLLDFLFQRRPDILNHNIETVRRLAPVVRPQADHDGSLSLLARAAAKGLTVKSGFMLGLGETETEIFETFQDLRACGVSSLTLGQYLPPSPRHFSVKKFYSEQEFDKLRCAAQKIFSKALVGPLVRSSYHADETANTVTRGNP